MSDSTLNRNPHCQLQVLPDACQAMDIFAKLRLYLLRVLVALEKKIRRQDFVISRRDACHEVFSPSGTLAGTGDGSPMAEGDWVTVRSMAEIQATLDTQGRCKGLTFMPEMESYCGRAIRIKKNVRAIFDERAWKMLKIKNTYLLDDCICDGKGMYGQEGCERCCFYFWKVDWLHKGVSEANVTH